MGWREVIIQTVWDYTGCTDARAETTCAGIEDRLADMPPADRIAMARELLEGTGRVVAVEEQTLVGTPATGVRVVRTRLVEEPTP